MMLKNFIVNSNKFLKGFTAALEGSSSVFEFYGSYTYSETTDNWVGAASGSIGATLSPGLAETGEDTPDWSEGTSDFDIPHRLSIGTTVRFRSVYESPLEPVCPI